MFADKGGFERLLKVADTEPPRGRAMLGAIGQQLGKKQSALQRHDSLNPFSKHDFGLLAGLNHAKKWASQEPSAGMKLFEHPDFENGHHLGGDTNRGLNVVRSLTRTPTDPSRAGFS